MYREPAPPPPPAPPPAPEESYRALLWGLSSLLLVPLGACVGFAASAPIEQRLSGDLTLLFAFVPGIAGLGAAVLVATRIAQPLRNPSAVKPLWSVVLGWIVLLVTTAITLPMSLLVYLGMHMGSPGRPFRGWLGARRARATRRSDWSAPIALDGSERDPVSAARWEDAALAEHASVASFAQLSLDLLELGAPPDLIRRCHLAAIEEIDHAEKAFALASVYGREPRGPGVLEVPRLRRRATRARVRTESIIDGCINEARAAEALRAEAASTTDPRLRELLSGIAADEEGHVRLAADIARFCTERS